MHNLIPVTEAEAIIRRHLTSAATEIIPLAKAQGRYLRQDIIADRPLPPFDRVMMDGIAINHASLASGNTRFLITGTQAAGAHALTLQDPCNCIEVMTGCVLPHGCDCVIPIEQCDRSDDTVTLHQEANPQIDQHIHSAGSDTTAGEILLKSGMQIGAPELSIAASVGATALQVSALPRILIITTGDEVVAPDDTPLPHQIRRSHAIVLQALITTMHLGIVENQHVRDDPEALAPIIAKALNTYDILIMTGGISRGKFDYVAPVLTELLGKPHFHGIAQRPGKPMAFWKSPDSPLVFGLPGNPVSVMACAIRYLAPALEEILSGVAPASHTLQATGTFHCPVHFTGLVPCQLKNGRIHLQAPSNSGNFLALAGTDGIAQLSGELAGKELLNEPASFYPWT